jgi:hypothetical protein
MGCRTRFLPVISHSGQGTVSQGRFWRSDFVAFSAAAASGRICSIAAGGRDVFIRVWPSAAGGASAEPGRERLTVSLRAVPPSLVCSCLPPFLLLLLHCVLASLREIPSSLLLKRAGDSPERDELGGFGGLGGPMRFSLVDRGGHVHNRLIGREKSGCCSGRWAGGRGPEAWRMRNPRLRSTQVHAFQIRGLPRWRTRSRGVCRTFLRRKQTMSSKRYRVVLCFLLAGAVFFCRPVWLWRPRSRRRCTSTFWASWTARSTSSGPARWTRPRPSRPITARNLSRRAWAS